MVVVRKERNSAAEGRRLGNAFFMNPKWAYVKICFLKQHEEEKRELVNRTT
jgi:hypothetical protein